MEKKTIIAPANSETMAEVLFATLKEFPTQKMILLYSTDGFEKAQGFADDLKKLGIASNLVKVDGKNQWDAYFRATVDACQGIPKNDVVINISSAGRIPQCAMTNAAHVNGLRAIAVLDGRMIMLPILRMSFSNVLSDKKMRILEALEGSCIGSLEDISKKTGMSLQLVSYHINGTPKSRGLKCHELVEANEEKGKIRVCLSTMGKLFMDGYIRSE